MNQSIALKGLEMDATTTSKLKQAQEALYYELKDVMMKVALIREMPLKDRMKAQGEIAEALLTVLRAKPETQLDRASVDLNFQRFKTKLLKKPRKNSRLAKELAA